MTPPGAWSGSTSIPQTGSRVVGGAAAGGGLVVCIASGSWRRGSATLYRGGRGGAHGPFEPAERRAVPARRPPRQARGRPGAGYLDAGRSEVARDHREDLVEVERLREPPVGADLLGAPARILGGGHDDDRAA